MDRQAIIAAIDVELGKLERAKALLSGSNSGKLLHGTAGGKVAKKRILSPEARQRIANAQKKRWAKQRKQAKAVKS